MEKLILARRNGALTVGALLQLKGQEALVCFQGVKEKRWVRRESIIWIGAEKEDDSVKISRWLEEQFQKLYDEAQGVDTGQLWEALSDADQVRTLSLDELRKASPGSTEGGLVMALELRRELFKRMSGGYQVFSQAEREAREERKKAPWSSDWRAKRVEILRSLLAEDASDEAAFADDTIVDILTAVGVATEKDGYPGRERKLLEEAFGYPLLRPELEAQNLLVRLGIWGATDPIQAHREGIPLRHATETEEEVRSLMRQSHVDRATGQGRRVVDSGHWIAIDEASTEDVDDALWAESLGGGSIRVNVAIADPSEWVIQGSRLWEAARERGASMYLPDGTYPMFPGALANHFCSLVVGEPRLALMFSWTVTSFSQVENFSVEEVILSLSERSTYEGVDGKLSEGAQGLQLLAEAASRMRRRRGNQGGLLLRQTEWKCSLDRGGNPQIKVLSPFSPAREIVSELMIATGILTGDYVSRNGIPSVYRCQSPPDEQPEFSVEDLSDAAELYELFRTMKRAEVSLQPGVHYMLGARAYSQVSSPLRRFCDLVMHNQIKTWLRTGKVAWTPAELGEVIDGVEDSVRNRLKVERECHRQQALRLLGETSGSPVRAQVVRRMGRRFLVALLDYGIREACHLRAGTDVGDMISIRIDAADAGSNVLKMSQA